MKLNVKAFALTTSLVWGLGLFILTWWVILFEGPNHDPNILTHLYRGYSITPVGSLIGLLYGLVDGLFGGACIAWVYNLFLPKEEK
jgi:hypothetical protein